MDIPSPAARPVPPERGDRTADLAIADECRLNALWLHGVAGGKRALEVEVPSLSLATGLAALYSEVERVPLSDLEGEHASRSPLPYAAGSFDLVTLYGHFPHRAALLELRRVLNSEGALLLAAGNRWWNGRWRGGAGQFPGRPADLRGLKALGEVGFAQVCTYWVEPTLTIPRNLIPATGGRARQFEATRAREWGGGSVRSLAVNAGLQAMVYPGLLVVARVTDTGAAGRA